MARHSAVLEPDPDVLYLSALRPEAELEEFACPRCKTAARCAPRGISTDGSRRLWDCGCGYGFGTRIGGVR